MMTNNVFELQRSGLGDFIYGEIGTETNGMPLTVLSALSRLGLDPWAEAARLAAMPSGPAAERMAQYISSLPGSLWSPQEAARIALRLVNKLPQPGQTAAAAPPSGGLASMLGLGAVAAARPGRASSPLDRAAPSAGGPPKALRVALLAALLASAGLGMALNGSRPATTPASGTAATTQHAAKPAAATKTLSAKPATPGKAG